MPLPEPLPAPASRHVYTLHGLLIDSALELPQLRPAEPGDADVTIDFGPVEPLPPDAAARFRNWTARPGVMVITALGSAHFRVEQGRRITIDALPGATADELISFTLGSAMSALLQQRGLLPLHASSVVTPSGALLVTGRSGVGKSTLTAQLVGRGLPLLADDVTAIDVQSGTHPLARSGLPAVRLWRDALRRLDKLAEATHQVREDVDKYYLPLPSAGPVPHPIRAIIRLVSKRDGSLELSELAGTDRFRWLNQHIHRKHFLPGMDLQRFAFDAVVRLATAVPVLQVTRPDRGVPPDEIAAAVLDWLGEP